LLRRSFVWGALNWFVLPPVVLIVALTILQNSCGYVSIERDFADRVVVRRGLPWLGFLPGIGDAVILDTGLMEDDLEHSKRGQITRLIHWEWRNSQSGVLQ